MEELIGEISWRNQVETIIGKQIIVGTWVGLGSRLREFLEKYGWRREQRNLLENYLEKVIFEKSVEGVFGHLN